MYMSETCPVCKVESTDKTEISGHTGFQCQNRDCPVPEFSESGKWLSYPAGFDWDAVYEKSASTTRPSDYTHKELLADLLVTNYTPMRGV